MMMNPDTILPLTLPEPTDQQLHSHLIFKTSGSTGMPKGIALSKHAILHSASLVNSHFNVSENDHWLLALPHQHIGGFSILARAYLASCPVSLYAQKWSPSQFCEQLAQSKATLTSLIPTQIHDLVAQKKCPPSSLRAVLVGGGQLNTELHHQAFQLGWLLYPTYGMTETASQISTAQSPEPDQADLKILPSWETRTEHDQRLSIKGPALFSGLYDFETKQFTPRQNEWFTTNDIAELHQDTLIPKGRADQQIKILGHLVNLATLEKELHELTQSEIILIPTADKRKGHALTPHHEAVNPEKINQTLEHWNKNKPAHEQLSLPSIQHETFPRSPLGKIQRTSLAPLKSG